MKKDIKFIEVDGERPVDEIQKDLVEVVENLKIENEQNIN